MTTNAKRATASLSARLSASRALSRETVAQIRLAAAYVVLPGTLVVSAGLRFWGLPSGIPYAPGADEPVVIQHAVRMMQTGDLNPHFFDYPSLVFYLQLVTATARFIVGALNGEWASLSQVGPEDFYLWGRAVTALLGVATTALVYACGTYWSRTHAGLAAMFSAVFPLHVRESHYALTDVPVTFFIALALLLSLRASRTPSARAFAAAGAAVGLAMATKYNAFVALLLPLVAAAGLPGAVALSFGAVALAAAAVCFLLGAPYTILDLPGFLNGFANLAAAYALRPGQEAGWSVYLKHLRLAVSSGGLVLIAAGLAITVAAGLRRGRAARHWLLVAFSLAYFAFISRQGLIFGRYLLPLTPFLALFVAIAILGIGDRLLRVVAGRWRRVIVAAVTVVALWPQLSIAIGFNRQITRPSTQALAYQWLLQNVPRGSKVVSEKYEIRLPERHFRVEMQLRLINRTYEDYLSSGTQYLIASSNVFGPALNPDTGDPASRDAYLTLFSNAREVFRTGPLGRRVGPEIRVFSLDTGAQ